MEWKGLEAKVGNLKKEGKFAEARQVLEEALLSASNLPEGNVWLTQQLALCTYKDPHLRPELKYRKALDILQGIDLTDPATRDPETLGLGGAIYKRMWEHYGEESYLRASLALYRAGWDRNPNQDRGYCGVNAAYILDLLASLTERTALRIGDPNGADRLRNEATALRREILGKASPPADDEKSYWALATFAELHFGLREFDFASRYLRKAKELEKENWKFQTTATQLLNIARYQNLIDQSPPGAVFIEATSDATRCRETLAVFLGEDIDAALGRFRGKVGLALSGGGFRAAFFHLGFLARLAEIDALRHVEVFSTVSGGSIVGVHYYLELKQLLEKRKDKEISREDYLVIVRRVQDCFLTGVQKNLRMRILENFCLNLRMLLSTSYTHSHRIGELYEDEIYSRVEDKHAEGTERKMQDLLIRPSGFDSTEKFKPRERNWLRRNKVPELVINTTALNSGHNFQFTASWFGEPPGLTGAIVDMNVRHRRLYYSEAPTDELRTYRLGYAVAASSCVPGLFDPLVINGLYPGRTVKLVDGGVHDNQGVAGLLDEGCDFIFCSDASGQMHDQVNPATSLLGVSTRSNDILMDRVRECQFDHLEAMALSGRLKGLFFIHLKKNLVDEDISWNGCTEKEPISQENQTPYGIDRDIQRLLSEIRTDLDSFSEVEAKSLMLSGYLMAEEQGKALNKEFRANGGSGSWGGFCTEAPRENWSFLQLASIAAKSCDSSDLRRADLEKQLAVGKSRFFKSLKLVPGMRVFGYLLIVLALIILALFVWQLRHQSVSFVTLTIFTALLAIFLTSSTMLPLAPHKKKKGLFSRLCLAFVGYVVAKVHLKFVNPAFLRRGQMDRLLRLPGEG